MTLFYIWILIFGFGAYAGQDEGARKQGFWLALIFTAIAIFINFANHTAGIN